MATRRPPAPHRSPRRRTAAGVAAIAASAGVLAWAGAGTAAGAAGPATPNRVAVADVDVSVQTDPGFPPTTTPATTTTAAPTTTTAPPTTTTAAPTTTTAPPTTTTAAPPTTTAPTTTQPPADRTPPAITCSARPVSLGNANNHKLVPVSADVSASDDSGSVTVVLASVTSNQADSGLGPDDVPGDITGWVTGSTGTAADTSGQLRRERYGSTRVYTLTYVARDAAGNTSTCATDVTVIKPG